MCAERLWSSLNLRGREDALNSLSSFKLFKTFKADFFFFFNIMANFLTPVSNDQKTVGLRKLG